MGFKMADISMLFLVYYVLKFSPDFEWFEKKMAYTTI
jgi:hypothetical protein